MMENMMNRLFSHISSDNNTLDQRNNKQATKQQPNLGQGQRNKDYTKTEITLCGAWLNYKINEHEVKTPMKIMWQ